MYERGEKECIQKSTFGFKVLNKYIGFGKPIHFDNYTTVTVVVFAIMFALVTFLWSLYNLDHVLLLDPVICNTLTSNLRSHSGE